MVLTDSIKGNSYVISKDNNSGKAKARLDSLGFVPGEKILVMSSSYAGLIVEIKGSRLAICKSVAKSIEVTEL